MKTQRMTTIRSICFVALLGIGAVTAAQAQTAAPATPSTTAAPMAPAAPMAGMPNSAMKGNMMGGDMKKSMMMDMEGMQKMQMSGDTDKDFASMMKMHHQQAVNMSEMELAQGKSPEMKAMAKKIISAQKKEIAQLDKWLAKQK